MPKRGSPSGSGHRAPSHAMMMRMVTPSPGRDPQRPPVLVRLATPNDLSALLLLYQELAGDRGGALPGEAVVAQPLFEEMAAQSGRHLLVAEIDGNVVGTADLLIVPNLTHGGAPWAIVENVVVDEGVRRSGVGGALIDEAVRRSRAAGCYKVQLLSNKQRRQAHQFYLSAGFVAVAEGFRRYLD
jgi:GNAT superfamily N-acetyltransferase